MKFTISIQDFIDSHLGTSLNELGNIIPNQHLWDCRPVKLYIAEIIYAIYNNEHTCYIQFPSEHSIQKNPILWSWKAWKESNENYTKQKEYAHKERIKRFLYEDNVDTLTKACIKEFGFDEDKAKAMALRWVAQGNKGALHICKVDKLKTKEEEL